MTLKSFVKCFYFNSLTNCVTNKNFKNVKIFILQFYSGVSLMKLFHELNSHFQVDKG